MKQIKPGYLVKITSWENDADNYRTVEFDGLTETAARTLIAVAKLFKSENGGYYDENKVWRRNTNCYGNADIEYDDTTVTEAIFETTVECVNKGWDVPKLLNIHDPDYADIFDDVSDPEQRNDFYRDAIYEIVGIWNEGEMYRVYESHEVYFVPENSIKNVTEQFA